MKVWKRESRARLQAGENRDRLLRPLKPFVYSIQGYDSPLESNSFASMAAGWNPSSQSRALILHPYHQREPFPATRQAKPQNPSFQRFPKLFNEFPPSVLHFLEAFTCSVWPWGLYSLLTSAWPSAQTGGCFRQRWSWGPRGLARQCS